jgi:hypothetical protein
MQQKPRKINMYLVKPDETLAPEEGWVKMVLRWLIDEKLQDQLWEL